jgi:hypothetical protein
MKTAAMALVLFLLAAPGVLFSQAAGDATFKAATSNIPGAEYPQINTERRARFRVSAPQAEKVELNLVGRHPMTKDPNGVWTITTDPLVIGFHYYSFVIDGVNVADPGSEAYFGSSWMSSGIEVPEPGVDFYDAKNVPHGEVRVRPYFSRSVMRGVKLTSIRRPVMTIPTRVIRCSICNTAPAKTSAAGRCRAARTSSSII